MKPSYKFIVTLFLGAFILMFFALYNGSPMISSDTEVYLKSGFEGIAAAERPIFYGLFIKFSSLGFSVWFTIFVQSLIVAYLLIRLIKHVVPSIDFLHLIALVLMISLGTISSWYVGQLMPDIFTPILGLALFCFIFLENSLKQILFLLGIIFFATLFHFSHYIILSIFAMVFVFFVFVFKKYQIQFRFKTIAIIIVSALSWLSLMSSNYFSNRSFVASNASHVFLMGKLCESGVLKTYLYKACPIKNYKICQFKDQLPTVAWDYVWDQKYNPTSDSLAWSTTNVENIAIINDIGSRPKYWGFMAFKSVEATMRQVILGNIDEGEERPWIKYDESDPVFKELKKRFPHEINLFKNSRQNAKTLNYIFYDEVYVVVMLISILLFLFCYLKI